MWLLIAVAVILFSGGIGMAAGSIGQVLTMAQLLQIAAAAGFTGNDLLVAASIAMAESNGNSQAIGDQNNPVAGAASYGLWQINSHYHPEFGPDFTTLFDPQTNANAAFSVYSQAGFKFTPWSTYGKTGQGKYLAYMPDATLAQSQSGTANA